MKILLITQWYKPIKGAGAKRTTKMARTISEQNHQVSVLTGMPSYPTGVLPQKYHWKFWAREKDEKIEILRTYEYPSPNQGVLRRIFNNLTFAISSSMAIFFLPKHEAVIVSSPPFISGLAGLLASKIWKADFYFDVRDLWPDSAISMKLLSKGLFLKISEKLEFLYYQKATKILTATPAIKKHLIGEGIPELKIITLLNSVDTNFFKPQTINRQLYGFKKSDFIACYIGNHSRVYYLENILKAAKLLKCRPNIKFLFVGEGEQKNDLLKLAENLKLANVIFWPLQKPDKIIKIINLADVGNVPLIPIKIFQEAIPTKTSEYLGCGKPIIASVSGDLKNYLETYQAGIVYKSGDPKEYAKAIMKLKNNSKLKQKMGRNARRLALDVFSDIKFSQTLKTVFSKF